MQADWLYACSQSVILWINTFCWTYHQWDVNPLTGQRSPAKAQHVPMITWEVQDDALRTLDWCLVNGEDILINKSRDMGASWICLDYIHWHWLFTPDAQLLEMSRTKDYVDKTGNMKALFQKHDYINSWLPWWMIPEGCHVGGKHRQNMHMYNELNGACIDGESTTKHAASGDRRTIILLDEFAKVEHGRAMRSATRDAGLMRIVNSTVAGPGTEYSRWKNSGQIKVYPLMWWDHPEKGTGRYVEKQDADGRWKIRSPWYNAEEKVRSPIEMAQEVDADDVGSGDVFFSPASIDTHAALFAKPARMNIDILLDKKVADSVIPSLLKTRKRDKLRIRRGRKAKLRLWCKLINGRPNQAMSYVFGIDLSKGHGASNSVVSIKCVETGEKIGEWACALTPPAEMARVVVALALWVGGRDRCNLPFLIWEKNGPGLDFGRRMVKEFRYPKYYKHIPLGKAHDKKSDSYGWHTSRESKEELLTRYDAALTHSTIVNHSIEALDEARHYIRYGDGGIGPAELVEESQSAKKCHGDRTMADAMTLLSRKQPRRKAEFDTQMGSPAHRRKLSDDKKRRRRNVVDGWRHRL